MSSRVGRWVRDNIVIRHAETWIQYTAKQPGVKTVYHITGPRWYDGGMSQKTIIWICVGIFGTIGGFIPLMWGDSLLSFGGLLGNGIGGLFGIWVGYKINQQF